MANDASGVLNPEQAAEIASGLERVTKKSGRHYKKAKHELPPINTLVPSALDMLSRVFNKRDTGPSVTTVLGILAKPALIGWAAKEERKMVAALAAKLYNQMVSISGEPMEEQAFADLIMEQAGKGAHKVILAKAANIGTEVHNRAEWELKGELGVERDGEAPKLTTEYAVRAFQRWTEWRLSVKLKPIALEKKIFSSVFGFGGTLDVLAEIEVTLDFAKQLMEAGYRHPDGEPEQLVGEKILVVIDYKTGKHIFEEYYLQNVAYRMALKEEGIEAPVGIIVRLPKYEDDPDFDAQIVPNDPDLEPTFLALRVVFQWWDKVTEAKKQWKKKKENDGKK